MTIAQKLARSNNAAQSLSISTTAASSASSSRSPYSPASNASLNVRKVSGPSPFPRSGFTAQVSGPIIFVFGGAHASKLCSNDVHRLATGGLFNYLSVERAIGSAPVERMYHASAVAGKKIYVYGGIGPQRSYDENVYCFNTGTQPALILSYVYMYICIYVYHVYYVFILYGYMFMFYINTLL
jgi:hypothetical protein